MSSFRDPVPQSATGNRPVVNDRAQQHRTTGKGIAVDKKSGSYRRSWKKWLAIYIVVAAVVYLIVYLAFFSNGSGGVGGGLY
jgi:hypothetical protein